MTATALQSLYGGKDPEQEREQEVHTPPWIIAVAREALGGTIDLDPCAASDRACHFATINLTLPVNSLELSWHEHGVNGVYVNPPFKYLEEWMFKMEDEARYDTRIVALYPFRPHRRWFWKYLGGSEVVFLHYNVKFVGHKNTFPAPLVMVGWNCTIPNLGERETKRIRP